jgi:hypothetical protein
MNHESAGCRGTNSAVLPSPKFGWIGAYGNSSRERRPESLMGHGRVGQSPNLVISAPQKGSLRDIPVPGPPLHLGIIQGLPLFSGVCDHPDHPDQPLDQRHCRLGRARGGDKRRLQPLLFPSAGTCGTRSSKGSVTPFMHDLPQVPAWISIVRLRSGLDPPMAVVLFSRGFFRVTEH